MTRSMVRIGLRVVSCLLLALVAAPSVLAGDSGYLLQGSEVAGDTGTSVEVTISLDITDEPILAWAVAVCHDVDVVTLEEVANGAVMATVNEGDFPDFDDLTLYDDGFVAGVLICLTSCDELPVGDDHELYVVTYSIEGLAPSTTDIEFCDDTLPAVNNEVSIDGGEAVAPDSESGVISIEGPEPLHYEFSTPDTTVHFDVSNGLAEFDQPIHILENIDNPEYPNAIESFTVVVSHVGTVLEATEVVVGETLEATHDGDGPDFFSADLLEEGISIDVIVADTVADGLLAETLAEVARVTYEANSTLLQLTPFTLTTDLTITDELLPGTPNVVASGDFFVGVALGVGTVSLEPREVIIRGDVNDDGDVNFDDAIGLLNRLFIGSPTIDCFETLDVNDDDQADIGDAISILAFLFLDGDAPAAPYPTCGFDTSEGFSCGAYDSCP